MLELPKIRPCLKILQEPLHMRILWGEGPQRERKCSRTTPRCALCRDNHPAWSKKCSYHQRERLAILIKAKEKVSIHTARNMASTQMQQPNPEQQSRNRTQGRNYYASQQVTPQISYAGIMTQREPQQESQNSNSNPRIHNNESHQELQNNKLQQNNERITPTNTSKTKVSGNSVNEDNQTSKSLTEYDIAKITSYVTRDIIKMVIRKIIPETLTMLLQVVQMSTSS